MAPNDLECSKAKGTPYMLKYYPQVSNFSFALQLLVLQIIEVFDLSIGNGEFEIFEKKSLKIKNSKFQKSSNAVL